MDRCAHSDEPQELARVVRSRELRWADLPAPYGRRPVCILTRDAALTVVTGVTVAPVTTTVRRIRSEVEVGRDEGLPDVSVITCDNLLTVHRSQIDPTPIGVLGPEKRIQLDRALTYALAIGN